MWVIVGPFKETLEDGEIAKFLRPNQSYIIGRKPGLPLFTNTKKLSKEHCKLTIGPHTVEDVSNLDAKPTLEMENLVLEKKAITVSRSSQADRIVIPPTSQDSLQDGDCAQIVSNVTINLKWHALNAFVPPELASAFSKTDCAALGIKIVHSPDSRISHHITPDLMPSLPIAASLLSLASFATPDWLAEVIRLGQLPQGQGSLLDEYILPGLKSYQPAYAPSLPSQFKIRKVWQPREERLNLFLGLRFICFFEKAGRADSELADAIHAGKGELEKFDVNLGVDKFRRALSRAQAKEGKKTVVIADAEAMEMAVGKQEWQEYVAEASRYSLAILPPSKIVEAAMEGDTTVLLSEAEPSSLAESPAPAQSMVVPSASETPVPMKEESVLSNHASDSPIGRRSRPLRRAVSRAPSADPQPATPAENEYVDPLTIDVTRRRRPPPRRFGGQTQMVTGLEDPSCILDAPPDLPPPRRRTPPSDILDFAAPAPAHRLKRRAVAQPTPNTQTNSSEIGETIREPPLKKFRALFESADSMDSDAVEASQTQAESEASQRRRPMGASTLELLREEEEETQHSMQSQAPRPLKRRVPPDEVADGDDMAIDEPRTGLAGDALRPSKKRAVENHNAVEKQSEPAAEPPAGKGAPAGKPDTNQKFLQALASTKRGKKVEDEFDRDFNNLKISKPALEREYADPVEDLKVLADFGDDSGLRGNFMEIIEMDLPERRSRTSEMTNCDWLGKPNFKKFKKKVSIAARKTVDLFVSDQDFGIGSAYWKKDDSNILDMSQDTYELEDSQTLSTGPSHGKDVSGALDSEDEDLFDSQPVQKATRTRSRASSRAPSVSRSSTLKTTTTTSKKPTSSSSKTKAGSSATPAATKGKGKAAALTSKTKANTRSNKATPLFLDSDEDIEEVDELQSTMPSQDLLDFDDDEGDVTMSTFPKAKTSRRAGSAVPAATRASSRKPTRLAPIVVDDSDDDGGFQGFG